MPKSKSEMMKRLYQSRKDAGLVEFRAWVTPAQHLKLVQALKPKESTTKPESRLLRPA